MEAAVGSTLQEVNMVELPAMVYLREPLLSALASRVSRQHQKMVKIEICLFDLTTKESAEALLKLVRNSDTGSRLMAVLISGNIEADGWAALAKVSDPRGLCSVQARAINHVKEGRREDLRTLWESGCCWTVGDMQFFKEDEEAADERSWAALEHLLDNS